MKRMLIVVAIALSFVAGAALSAQVRDWHDLDAVHTHLVEAIHEMEHAAKLNHYDMQGHAKRAEEHMRSAERELGLAIDAAKASAP